MEVDVFERSTSNDRTINAAAYNVIMGLTLCWGFAVNWLMVAKIDPQMITEIIPWWMFFVGYFASCFFGVYLFNGSDNPLVSFVGYNFVVLP
ncbi:hypothetical protein ACXYTJ_10230 [Gilvimarinus sp. F26214L]|uniref:hypothetical protein n=1 Tax=Gilvimarinus sp. DZF01 TaxID=3461371 RepID=UPI004045ECA1